MTGDSLPHNLKLGLPAKFSLRVMIPAVIQPVPNSDDRSADEVMAEWLLLYEHSEEIQRRLKLLSRNLTNHINERLPGEVPGPSADGAAN